MAAQSVHVQMLELGALFMLQTVVVFSLFGVCAGMIGGWLKRRPRVGVWLDRLAGATFIAHRHSRGVAGLSAASPAALNPLNR